LIIKPPILVSRLNKQVKGKKIKPLKLLNVPIKLLIYFASMARSLGSLFVSTKMHHVAFDFLEREITNWRHHYQWHQQANMHIHTHFGPHLCHISSGGGGTSLTLFHYLVVAN
jgi:hypothetical protein